jgi:glycosyltransferase involved in cell wall biosynthesis
MMISRACLIGAYQSKLEAIASHPDIELTAVVPAFWREGSRYVRLEQTYTEGYQLIVAPVAWNGRFHLHYFPTVSSLLAGVRPDLLHMDEEPYNLATYHALRAARRVGVRTLFFSWQNLDRRYPWPFRRLERWVHRAADAAIAGTEGAAEVLRRKGYEGTLRVIPQFGVDPHLFRPATDTPDDRTWPSQRLGSGNGLRPFPFTIGYAGRLVPEKGLDTLVEAVGALSGDWRLLICGWGPWRARLEHRLKRLGLMGRVTFREDVSATKMPAQYAAMDVLVLPSRTRPNWKEQFGRVLIEAMACGVPVVGSDSGAIPGVIGDAGLVFPEGDAMALRDHLATLMADPNRRRALGARGRQRVLERFSQERIADQTVALYRALCQGREPRPGPGGDDAASSPRA